MTKKAPRVAALPKRTAADLAKYSGSRLVDTTVAATIDAAALRDALGLYAKRVYSDEFRSWLGRRVGQYRELLKAEAARPTAAEDAANLAEIDALVSQLQLRLAHLPSLTRADIDFACQQVQRRTFAECREALTAELQTLRATLDVAMPGPAPKGRTSAPLRDALLHDVAKQLHKLGLGLLDAADAAASILREQGIAAPTDPHDARALIRATHARGAWGKNRR